MVLKAGRESEGTPCEPPTTGGFNYHFSDKSDILRALANIILDEAVSDSHKLLKSKSEPIVKRVQDLVSGLVYRLRTSPYELNCMFDPAYHGESFAR